MNPQKTKILVKNIVTSIIVVGLLVIIYFVLKKDTPTDTPIVNGASTDTVTNANVIDIRVARSVKELSDLKSAVVNTAALFSTAAFRGLEDFSVVIPTEPVGRENPFIKTEWKIRIEALEQQVRTL